MKKLIRKIFKKKPKQVTPSLGGVAAVIRINDESKYVHESLGITDERAIVLQKNVMEALMKNQDIVNSFCVFHTFTLHQNEFAFCIWIAHGITSDASILLELGLQNKKK